MENTDLELNSSYYITKKSSATSSGGCSKAQLSLLKILRIIQTIPPPPEIPLAQMEEEILPPVAVDDEGLVGQEVLQSVAIKEEIEPFEMKAKDCDNNQDRNKEENCKLGLLIEAARLILNGDHEAKEDEEEEEMKKEKKQRVVDYDVKAMRNGGQQLKTADLRRQETEVPRTVVVRSRRGRPQVLPEMYRDSVLEPCRPSTRTRPAAAVNTRSKSIVRRKLLQSGS